MSESKSSDGRRQSNRLATTLLGSLIALLASVGGYLVWIDGGAERGTVEPHEGAALTAGSDVSAELARSGETDRQVAPLQTGLILVEADFELDERLLGQGIESVRYTWHLEVPGGSAYGDEALSGGSRAASTWQQARDLRLEFEIASLESLGPFLLTIVYYCKTGTGDGIRHSLHWPDITTGHYSLGKLPVFGSSPCSVKLLDSHGESVSNALTQIIEAEVRPRALAAGRVVTAGVVPRYGRLDIAPTPSADPPGPPFSGSVELSNGILLGLGEFPSGEYRTHGMVYSEAVLRFRATHPEFRDAVFTLTPGLPAVVHLEEVPASELMTLDFQLRYPDRKVDTISVRIHCADSVLTTPGALHSQNGVCRAIFPRCDPPFRVELSSVSAGTMSWFPAPEPISISDIELTDDGRVHVEFDLETQVSSLEGRLLHTEACIHERPPVFVQVRSVRQGFLDLITVDSKGEFKATIPRATQPDLVWNAGTCHVELR